MTLLTAALLSILVQTYQKQKHNLVAQVTENLEFQCLAMPIDVHGLLPGQAR